MKDLPEPYGTDMLWIRKGDTVPDAPGKLIIGNTRLPIMWSIAGLGGIEAACRLLYDKPQWIRDTVGVLAVQQMEHIKYFADSGCNAIHWCDDFGTQAGAIISPQMLDDYFGSAYRALYDYAHSRGMTTILHSCGKITELLPTLKNFGLDVIQTDQPILVGLTELRDSGLIVYAPVDLDRLAVESPDRISDHAFRLTQLPRFWGKAPWGIKVKFPPENIRVMCERFAA